MFDFIKRYFSKNEQGTQSSMPEENVAEETIGEPASLLLWSLENEKDRWERGEWVWSHACGDMSLKDKITGKEYGVCISPVYDSFTRYYQ